MIRYQFESKPMSATINWWWLVLSFSRRDGNNISYRSFEFLMAGLNCNLYVSSSSRLYILLYVCCWSIYCCNLGFDIVDWMGNPDFLFPNLVLKNTLFELVVLQDNFFLYHKPDYLYLWKYNHFFRKLFVHCTGT